MNKIFCTAILCCIATFAAAGNRQLYDRLDSVIAHRQKFVDEKNKKIAALNKKARSEKDNGTLLRIYMDLYSEYYVYQFDSAMIYVNKGLELAVKTGNKRYEHLNTIAVSELLAIGGLYSEAISNMDRLPADALEDDLLFKYHFTYFQIYRYWSDYCSDDLYSPEYGRLADSHLRRAMSYLTQDDILYEYYMGEYYVYVEHDNGKAMRYYRAAFGKLQESSRDYARTAFAIANHYSAAGDYDKYEEYLLMAGISDMICATKENLALQYLAMRLFELGEEHLERTYRYINVSMEDAKFYNNRLRMLEVSKTLPLIVAAYQNTIKRQNDSLKYAVYGISLLVAGLVVSLLFIARQNKLLSKRRVELSRNNTLLTGLNGQLSELNDKLTESNRKLTDTNNKRERLAKIYIDLCAKYIDKLKKYQTLVRRKIKAGQAAELLTAMSSSRISEDDAATFMDKFDKAFLDLYPSFVGEFNELLRDGERVEVSHAGTMTAELRIYALIRLGVKDCQEIADLLFYSPQTIYNYRSAMRSRAKDKDSFEESVRALCKTV